MAKKQAQSPSSKSQPAAVAMNALYHFVLIREQLMVKVASAIHERHWTQAQAAKFLGVSQPRISDLMRAKANKFTVDMLIQWLLAMGKNVQVIVGEDRDMSQSNAGKNADAEEAVEFFTGAILLDPKNAGAFHNRGDQYFELKKYDLAIGDYSRAAELAPDRPGPRNQRALAYRYSGQLKAALQEAEELIRLWPDYSGGYAQRAATYVLLQDYDKALADYGKDIEMEPVRPGTYLNRANIYLQLGQFQKAIDDFDQVLRINPNLDFARQARAEAESKLSEASGN
jgi:tetratricopeptide (TPR) repeat protein